MNGADYAFTHPSPAALKEAGITFVGRYASNDPSKDLSNAEAEALASEGISIVLVWESTAARAEEGYAAGEADATVAANIAKTCDAPSDAVIYFSVDTDTTWEKVTEYFQGVDSVIPHTRTGVYGSYAIVQGAHKAGYNYLWQTAAWSGGAWFPTDIRQSGSRSIGGVEVDLDEAMNNTFGQWKPTTNDTPPPPKPPVATGPTKEGPLHYEVVSGDTWGSIAERHGLTAQALFDYNLSPEAGRPATTIAELKERGINTLVIGELVLIP